MPESAPEATPPIEIPKPGGLTAVRERIRSASVATAKDMLREMSESDRRRAEDRHLRHQWQLGMLDSLVSTQMKDTQSFDPEQTEEKMTAQRGAELLQKWIEEVLDNPHRKRDPEDMSDEDARRYAEDLLVKLSDEASSHPD